MSSSVATKARLKPGETLGDRIVKVNHAGENGAVWIYTGQIHVARILHRRSADALLAFRQDEQRHRVIFENVLCERGLPRCRSYLMCGIGGYALGLVTGLLGASATSATTVAVEEVVLRHLHQQLAALGSLDARASAAILSIIEEEQLHHDASASNRPSKSLWWGLILPVVGVATESVIWIGMHA